LSQEVNVSGTRAGLAACAAFVVALLAPLPAAAQATLTGEILNGTAGAGAFTVDCEEAGTSTIVFQLAGEALGPYPGTFVESGTLTIVGGQVQSFEADFTIESGTTVVEGTKTLRTSFSASCADEPELGVDALADVFLETSYEVTVTTPTGTFEDAGRAATDASFVDGTGGSDVASSQQTFVSEAPLPTAGRAHGAGLIHDAVRGPVAFGFTARSDGTTATARCDVLAFLVYVRCLNATAFVATPTHATLTGQARVNGVLTTYTIDVDDLGEPGRNEDTFTITTGTGFTATGVLRAGNVRIGD
jgi:hypothetical protein